MVSFQPVAAASYRRVSIIRPRFSAANNQDADSVSVAGKSKQKALRKGLRRLTYLTVSTVVSVASAGLLLASLLLAGTPDGLGLDMVLSILPLLAKGLVDQFAEKRGLFNVTDISQVAPPLSRQAGRFIWPLALLRHPLSRENRKRFTERHTDWLAAKIQAFGKHFRHQDAGVQDMFDSLKNELSLWGKVMIIGRFFAWLAFQALRQKILSRFMSQKSSIS